LASGVYTYAYDLIGNSLTTTHNTTPTTYTPNALNQYAQVGPSMFTYDSDGNLLTDGSRAYTYDAENRLTTVSSNNTLLVSNAYDHHSRRILKTTPTATTTYLYDNWNFLLETVDYSNNTTDEFEYFWGKDLSDTFQGAGGVGGLLAVCYNGNYDFPFYDHNGNITDYVDAYGFPVAHYEYDAFGNTLVKTGSMADVFRHRFSTKYYDPETGLYYYGYRYYCPILRRWLNCDPLGEEGGLNLYAFCVNNPLNKWDYWGMSAYWDNYPKYTQRDATGNPIADANSYETTAVWQMVGGRLLWEHLIDEKEENYYNSCALRVSISLNKSGKTIGKNDGADWNFNKKADKDVNKNGVQVVKGQLLKAHPDENQRYFIRASQVPVFFDKSFPNVEKLTWKNQEEAQKHKNCIEKNDAEAYFFAKGSINHAGMIKKGYKDPYYQNYTTGQIWVITGSCYKEANK
jgi:RHS repeat-associated protein